MKPIDSILLIDDDEVANYINTLTIKRSSYCSDIHVKIDANDALEYLVALYNQNKKLPSLILLDINMPGMDGWDFLKEYSQLPENLKRQTHIIMLTTSFNPDDESRAKKENEVILFLNKPLRDDHLTLIIQQLNKQNTRK